jgi:hypothetical protein
MSRYPCYFVEESNQIQISLRRFRSRANEDNPCPVKGYHDARIVLDVRAKVRDGDGAVIWPDPFPRDDARWPTHCVCGYEFCQDRAQDRPDYWQTFTETLWRRLDTGELVTLSDAPPGALWYEDRYVEIPGFWKGPDGHVLMCKTPGGDWCVDSRASNCTLPQDNEHRCWVRHGDPTDPLGLRTGQPLHVDKNGLTCAAGAGSIGMGENNSRYHGFLHGGHLVEA